MRLLVIVTSDPRLSPRPAEAVRIAAGVAVWREVQVTIWLHGSSVLGLDDLRDDLWDASLFGAHFVLLRDSGGRVLVSEGNPFLKGVEQPWVPYEVTRLEELAGLAAEHGSVLRF
jgi:hypothetical protein